MRRKCAAFYVLSLLGIVAGNLVGCSDDGSDDSDLGVGGSETTGGTTSAKSAARTSTGGGINEARGGSGGTSSSTEASGGGGVAGASSLGGNAGAINAGSAGWSGVGQTQATGGVDTTTIAQASGGVTSVGDTSSGGTSTPLINGGTTSTGGNATIGGLPGIAGAFTAGAAGAAGAAAGSAGAGGLVHAGGTSSTGGTSAVVICPPTSGILCTTTEAPSNDSDCDGIPDSIEMGSTSTPLDTDGDHTPDYTDKDADGDGILDVTEVGATCHAPRDSDGDGIPDYRDTDSDGNGILDRNDSKADTDGDGRADYLDLDDDGDALRDVTEIGPNPATPVDTDGDKKPDYLDTDSDGDTISDLHEADRDTDNDGIRDRLELDSDADGCSDRIEAGDAVLSTAPVDTDGDGLPDFIDTDSDQDGLFDFVEDKDGDGAVEAGESDRTAADTDGDGASDLIESTAGTDPRNPGDTPAAQGDFFFTVPYEEAPSPTSATLDFTTRISRADVFFLLDSTGSMSGTLSSLTASLSTTIIPSLAAEIASVGIGIGNYRDFPTGDYGSSGDQPFHLDHRIMTARTTAGMASLQSALSTVRAGGGADGPESSWEALHQVATGLGNTTGNANVPRFFPATATPTTPVTGEELGTLPGVGFRKGALPIVVYFTDAEGHNSDTVGGSANTYASPVVSPRSTTVIEELNAVSAKVIGVATYNGTPRTDQLSAVNGTGAIVPPTAWGAVGTGRPAGCAATQCCTGLSGAGESPVAGNCPLSFLVNSGGTGLSTAVVAAIKALTSHGTMDISAVPVDDPSDSVDAVAQFVQRVVANPSAGAPCDSGLTAIDTNSDGYLDTFVDVQPGKRVCFDVLPKMNANVYPDATAQTFKASINVMGDGVAVLDTRDVYFLVPAWTGPI